MMLLSNDFSLSNRKSTRFVYFLLGIPGNFIIKLMIISENNDLKFRQISKRGILN